MVAHNSCSKREEINAEWISNQAYKMIKDLIDIEERTTLQYTFYNIAMKTSFEAGQIKRIYYKEWKIIPAYLWERLKFEHRRLVEIALENMKHKEMLMRQKINDVDSFEV